MKSGTHIALAVAAGYVLGRRRKAKIALMVGGAAATGGFGGVTRQLLKRGTHLVGSSDALGKISPELGEVTDLIRSDLVDAGKAAALTAVRGRIDKMSDSLHERAGALRLPDEAGAGAEKVRGQSEKLRGQSGKLRRRTGPDDEAEADDAGEPEDYAETGEDEEFDEPEDAADAQDYDEEAEPEEAGAEDFDEDEDAEDAEMASAGNGRRTRSSSGGSPIRRTRR